MKYQVKNIRIRIFEFAAKAQFLKETVQCTNTV